jgi:hypothetical protein
MQYKACTQEDISFLCTCITGPGTTTTTTTTTTTPPLRLVFLLFCCSGVARLAPFHAVRISMASFKQFIHYHNYRLQKQCTNLATHVLEKMSQIYHPASFAQSIATLCPPSVINSITFSTSLRGLMCHVTGDAVNSINCSNKTVITG